MVLVPKEADPIMLTLTVQFAGIAQFIFWITVVLVKISITLFNRRLTGLTSERWMVAHNIFLGLLVCYLLIAVFLDIFQCIHPVGVQFDLHNFGSLKTKPQCINPNATGIALSVIHVTLDFALLCVPLIVLYKIQMSTAKKLRVGFLFSIGSISCIGSVMRQVTQYHQPLDVTWSMGVINWTTIDIFFAITAASLPVLNALVPKRWRFSVRSFRPFSSRSHSGRSGQNRASVRLGSHESVSNPARLPHGAREPKFHDESILNVDNVGNTWQETTAPDGTVLPVLRGAARLDQEGDIEKDARGFR